jgi:hypothetical protein
MDALFASFVSLVVTEIRFLDPSIVVTKALACSGVVENACCCSGPREAGDGPLDH